MPASSNLYGVANAPGAPQGITIGGNISCPIGVETAVISSPPMIAPSPGWFSVLITGHISISYGATVPAAINYQIKFSGGSDLFSLQWAPGGQAAGAWQILPFNYCIGPYSSQWQAPGSVLQLTVTATGQPVTAMQFGCIAYFTLLRAPDQ
jgi:hypothetical protein